MQYTGHIFFIMGVSGSGKGTLRKNLEALNLQEFTFMKSYVTRPMRSGEVDGDVYHFVSQEQFQKSIDAREFLEYEKVHNLSYYGTKYDDAITSGIALGKKLLKEVDMRGLKNIYSNYPELKDSITTIFLDISEEKLAERIQKRGAAMSENELQERQKSQKIEKKDAKLYCDYIIDTTFLSPEEVLSQVLDIIQ